MSHDDTPPKLDEALRQRVRAKARRLVGKQGISEEEAQDIEQELLLHLHEHLKDFDATRSPQDAFVSLLIRSRLLRILRDRRADKRRPGRTASLEALFPGEDEPAGKRAATLDQQVQATRRGYPGESAQEQLERALDVSQVVAGLSPELRTLAGLLRTQSIAEAARTLGVPRTTLHDRVRELRRHFERSGLRLYF